MPSLPVRAETVVMVCQLSSVSSALVGFHWMRPWCWRRERWEGEILACGEKYTRKNNQNNVASNRKIVAMTSFIVLVVVEVADMTDGLMGMQ